MTMLRPPKVSIVLPTYNGSKWIKESIESIINQSYSDWELIIVNDCSTDNTKNIIESYEAKDSRIKIITNNKNLKLPNSLNVGFSAAQGQYLTWTSDDNIYKPDAIATLTAFLDANPQVDLISMNSDIINDKGEIIGDFDSGYIYKRCPEYLIHMNNVGAAFMYRHSIAHKVGRYADDLFCAEDYDYWCRIALEGTISYSPENIYQYRVHSKSLSKTKRKLVLENTNRIRSKYAPGFFAKYNFSFIDKAKLSAHNSNFHWPPSVAPICLMLKLYGLLMEIITTPIFWNKELRRHIKNTLKIHNKYSFSRLNQK